MKVLLSAYACEPGKGSEPGVGWNWARALSRHHEVWVLTRRNNRPVLEPAIERGDCPGLHVVYCDVPDSLRKWKRGKLGILIYYYLWQWCAYRAAKDLHREVAFDVVHHVTFVKYWMPSFLASLGPCFVWGPVGGGESTPKPFLASFSIRGRIYERLRDVARRMGQLDPFVLLTARRSAIGLATTEETAVRLRQIGCGSVRVYSEAGLTAEEIERLSAFPVRSGNRLRFVSIGNLLHLKGFDLGIKAFARYVAAGGQGEYWVIGDGPEGEKLHQLAEDLGVGQKVRFWGRLPRHLTLETLAECDVLVHPSLHDSGGWVCLEAMAAGRPVVCLDLGGPATQVTDATGIKVKAHSPEQAIADIARAFHTLAEDESLRARLSAGGRARVAEEFCWDRKSEFASQLYAMAEAGARL
ncbi:MAG: glycosyltransferase [Bryobacteraceae bacterium]